MPGGQRGPHFRTGSFVRVVTLGGPRTGLYKQRNDFEEFRDQWESLGFTEPDLTYMYEVFCSIDADGSGQISLTEMLDHLDVDRTSFAKRVFSIFDEDLSGEIDFREFVLSMWNYCTLTRNTLILFAFDLYDADNSGFIEPDEVKKMLKDVYGRKFKDSKHARKIFVKLTAASNDLGSRSDAVSVPEFEQFSKTHPALLYPAYVFQSELQNRCMGSGFWMRKANKRLVASGGRHLNAVEFLKAQVNAKAFKKNIVDRLPKVTADDRQKVGKILDNSGSVTTRRAGRQLRIAAKAVQAGVRIGNNIKSADDFMADRESAKKQMEQFKPKTKLEKDVVKSMAHLTTKGGPGDVGVRNSVKCQKSKQRFPPPKKKTSQSHVNPTTGRRRTRDPSSRKVIPT